MFVWENKQVLERFSFFLWPGSKRSEADALSLCDPDRNHELVASTQDIEHALQTSQLHARKGDILKYGFVV